MKLPRRYLVTGDAGSEENWWICFSALLEVSDAFIQFRPVGQNLQSAARWAEKALRLARARGRKVLLNGDPDTAVLLDMDGVHLSSRRLMGMNQRPLPVSRLVGASCHNQRELEHAQHIGADFACLSPVCSTGSHPGARPMGLGKFRDLASRSAIPVFALGGMQQSDLPRVQEAGGYGVAGISAWWGQGLH